MVVKGVMGVKVACGTTTVQYFGAFPHSQTYPSKIKVNGEYLVISFSHPVNAFNIAFEKGRLRGMLLRRVQAVLVSIVRDATLPVGRERPCCQRNKENPHTLWRARNCD